MDTKAHELINEPILHRDLVFQIVGCAFDVVKELGHGLHEKPYENALVIAFQDAEIPVQQQVSHPIHFKGRLVGEYVPDLIVGEAVIVDTKVIEHITDHERGQMLNYLRITGLRVGLIINFKRAKLEW
jgi:GxxExxY protein